MGIQVSGEYPSILSQTNDVSSFTPGVLLTEYFITVRTETEVETSKWICAISKIGFLSYKTIADLSYTNVRLTNSSNRRAVEADAPKKLNLEHQNQCKEAIKNLLYTASIQNLDDKDADPVTQDAVDAALSVVKELPDGIQLPEIFADPEGNVEFDWDLDNGTMFTISGLNPIKVRNATCV